MNLASPDTIESWSLSAEPSVVTGGTDEREDYLLHQVIEATRLGDGRIVIANGYSLELRYYDPNGNHLFDVGGEGEGPGEFRSLNDLIRLPVDSILVYSWGLGLARWGPDGRYAGLSPFTPPPFLDCRTHVSHLLHDGSLLMVFDVFVGTFRSVRCPIPDEPPPVARIELAAGLFRKTVESVLAQQSVQGPVERAASRANLARRHEHVVLRCLGSSAYRHRRPRSLRFMYSCNLTHLQGTRRDGFYPRVPGAGPVVGGARRGRGRVRGSGPRAGRSRAPAPDPRREGQSHILRR